MVGVVFVFLVLLFLGENSVEWVWGLSLVDDVYRIVFFVFFFFGV